MIYLNHLGEKYPNWDRIYMAKAVTHYILHEPVSMKEALGEACRLGDRTACDDLQNIEKVHAYDFGLSIIDWVFSIGNMPGEAAGVGTVHR